MKATKGSHPEPYEFRTLSDQTELHELLRLYHCPEAAALMRATKLVGIVISDDNRDEIIGGLFEELAPFPYACWYLPFIAKEEQVAKEVKEKWMNHLKAAVRKLHSILWDLFGGVFPLRNFY